MTQLMKLGEFAARHKVVPSAVTAWRKRGLIVFAPDPERPGKQLVDVEKSDLLVRGVIDQTRGRPRTKEAEGAGPVPDASSGQALPPPVPMMTGLEAARLEGIREQTLRRRIDNERLIGGLVPLAEYERRAGDLGRLIRERSHGLIRQHAERLAAMTDPREVMTFLAEVFDQLFNQVADEIEAQASAEIAADAALAEVAGAEEEEEAEEA